MTDDCGGNCSVPDMGKRSESSNLITSRSIFKREARMYIWICYYVLLPLCVSRLCCSMLLEEVEGGRPHLLPMGGRS